jgi:hypothetical protein
MMPLVYMLKLLRSGLAPRPCRHSFFSGVFSLSVPVFGCRVSDKDYFSDIIRATPGEAELYRIAASFSLM